MGYFDTTRYEDRQDAYNHRLVMAQHKFKVEGVQMVSAAADAGLATDFASILAWAYDQGDDAAYRIAKHIGLEETHVYAILDYKQEFEDSLIKEKYELYSNEF